MLSYSHKLVILALQDQRHHPPTEPYKELMNEIRRLREDRDYIETVARRELGLVKENELIIKFNSEEKE